MFNGFIIGLLIRDRWLLFKRELERARIEVVPKVAQDLYFTIHLYLHNLVMVVLDKILERLLAALVDKLQGGWILAGWLGTLKMAYKINGEIGEVLNAVGWEILVPNSCEPQ